MTIKGVVWWSIYVRANSIDQIQNENLSPIDELLGHADLGWEVLKENDNPGLVRLVTHQNLEAGAASDIICQVIARAYRLSDGWTIHGLQALTAPGLGHVSGVVWKVVTPVNGVPDLESAVFKLQAGSILGRSQDGGWRWEGGGTSLTPRDE